MRHLTYILIAIVTFGFAAQAKAADNDFKFLELRRELRANPQSPQAKQWQFGIAEYYFESNVYEEAEREFSRLEPDAAKGGTDLLATVYLLRLARLRGDEASAALFEKRLAEALSEGSFLATFKDSRTRGWTSPLGNRFDFREKVDGMDIAINGRPFHSIRLA